jgi:hypothetical protein
VVVRNISQVKNLILRPATTSHFECFFNPPPKVASFMEGRAKAGAGTSPNLSNIERINISCCDASLPGSNLQLATLTDSYPGVTENYAYRRAYDNRSDFTFYVDYMQNGAIANAQPYSVIFFFENWISYAINEKLSGGNSSDPRPSFQSSNYFNRVNFPEDYIAAKIVIQKFEKEASGKVLVYDFINAFPFSIASMPVSYEASQVLKCTVSFSYQRYLVKTAPYGGFK